MLAPRDTPTRERKSLDGLWRFALDADGVGRERGLAGRPARRAREMPVPASYNDIFADTAVHDHVGDAWYQTTSASRRGWAGERIVLRFDSATHRAVVWVDGDAGRRARGRLHAVRGRRHRRRRARRRESGSPSSSNNVLSWQSIPPGLVEETPDGPRQRYFHDFFNYAGLHRTVWLYTHARAHVDDVTVVTGLDGSTGTVALRGRADGGEGLEVRVALRDAEGARSRGQPAARGELTVEDVHPWRPGEGYLYELDVELWGDGDAPVDVYPLPVGHPHRARRRHALPDQRRAVLLHAASASTRTAPSAARATTTRSWSTTSR